ncbi:hypothetical protein [Priestia megaterium]|uniref:hypothetical protein n=1 Tax=Priestia megaterium TaxID=1404 RepID=UPI002FFE842E
MDKVWVQLAVAIVPAIIAYFTARYQANSSLKTVKEQQTAELEKLKEQHNSDMQKLKEQQNAEIEKIREQSTHEIAKISAELDKQAELYEKNAQTDFTKEVMSKMLGGDMSAFENLMKFDEMVGGGSQPQQGKVFKQHNHPKKKR